MGALLSWLSPRRDPRLLAGAWFALQLTLLCAAPQPAAARMGAKVGVRLLPGSAPATDGQPYHGTLELRSKTSGVVEDFQMTGEGWRILSLEQPPSELPAGRSQTIRFSAVPTDAYAPLRASWLFNGHLVESILEPSSRVQKSAAGPLRLTSDGVVAPQPKAPADATTQRAARTIRVRGRLRYHRDDGVQVPADHARVKIMEADIIPSERARGETDNQGFFDLSFTWDPCPIFCEAEPDIYVEFETENDVVNVTGGVLAPPYKYASDTVQDFTGVDLNFGSLAPSDETMYPPLHILTNITRAHRWLLTRVGHDVPKVEVDWPTLLTWYNAAFDLIEINHDREGREPTHVHEWGHHVMDYFAATDFPNFCNGSCDLEYSICGHCSFCEENASVAWSEGFPEFMGHVVPRTFLADYGLAPQVDQPYESMQPCTTDTSDVRLHDPLVTEGFLAGLLVDIEDSEQDTDGNTAQLFIGDELDLSAQEIFTVAGEDLPTTPQEFIDAFLARFPQHREAFWATAVNNSYQLDVAGPGGVTNLTSPSHPLVGDTADSTPAFNWTRASDDMSGIEGYSFSITPNASGVPDETRDLGDVTTFTRVSTLSPGSYFFNIRALDRRGQWSSTTVSYGPFRIRAATPANLTTTALAGWADPAVPRPASDATASSCPAPATLAGNTASTWCNWMGINSGDAATTTFFQSGIVLDGAPAGPSVNATAAAGTVFGMTNAGPITVRGGRHTFAVRYDMQEVIAEADESDNEWARQWIWSPLTLGSAIPFTRAAPPLRDGGWDPLAAGLRIFNCDGLRFSSSVAPWMAVAVRAFDPDVDYDVRMHQPSTGPTSGFTSTHVGYSTRPAGRIDAVLVNRAVAGSQNWDVGVLNHSGATSDYIANRVTSSAFNYGDSLVVTMPQDRYMILRAVTLSTAQLGGISVAIETDPAQGTVQVGWLDANFSTGGLLDVVRLAATDASGKARMNFATSQAGVACVVLYRDPVDVVDPFAPPLNIVLEVEPWPPDLTPYKPTGWYAPLVPRPAADGAPSAVPAPASLAGNVAATYLNAMVASISNAIAPPALHQFLVDGGQLASFTSASLAPGAGHFENRTTPINVPGGRHTLSIHVDEPAAVEETSEANNVYGEQWVWSPQSLAMGSPLLRPAPPGRTSAWDDITSGETRWFNCDGLRTAAPSPSGESGHWVAVAVMPAAGADVDVRIHEIDTGVKNGFRVSLASSAWSPDESDFVLANLRATAPRSFDVGVLRDDADVAASYTAHLASSTHLGLNPTGIATTTLEANQIVDLYEMTLTAGMWNFELVSETITVDWGFSLHPGSSAYMNKGSVVSGGIAWLAGPGQDELFQAQIPQNGTYCLAVWKARSSALAIDAQYKLRINQPSTAVDGPPTAPMFAGLTSIHPNPFNPRTTIEFQLDRQQSARLAIYNARGVRVRTLLDGVHSAGRRQVVWDGLDDVGSAVASGAYVVVLQAGDVTDRRKLVLVR